MRFKYYIENQQKISSEFKSYLHEKQNIEITDVIEPEESKETFQESEYYYENIGIQSVKNGSNFKRSIKKTQSLPDLFIDINTINAVQRKNEELELKRKKIKTTYEKFKNIQERNLKEIETERNLQHEKIVDKLKKNQSVMNIRKNHTKSQYSDKILKIRQLIESKEKEQDQYIINSIDKFNKIEEKIKERIELTKRCKSESARSMSKNLLDKKQTLENEILFEKANHLINRLKKIENIKYNKSKDALEGKMFKQSKNANNAKAARKRIVEEDNKYYESLEKCKNKMLANKDHITSQNYAKQIEKKMKIELGRLQANTRIARNKLKHVSFYVES